MRFKTIFAVFNVVIVISFLFIFFMPLFLLGGSHFGEFVSRNWLSGALFVVALAGFNAYFVANWSLFALLEREDWPALIRHLERMILEQGHLRSRYIKILINTYLVTSETGKIVALQNHLAEQKPDLVARFAVQFGIPYLMRGDPQESERYFGKMLARPRLQDRDWIRWDYAFALIQMKQVEAAQGELVSLTESSTDPVLRLLALYLLHSVSTDQNTRTRIEAGRESFRSAHTLESWNKKVDRARDNMQVLVLSRIIKEASEWAFGPRSAAS